jgi:hypothetical protein
MDSLKLTMEQREFDERVDVILVGNIRASAPCLPLSRERDKPVDPVPGLPVEMGYGNDNNGVMIDPVDHAIRKPRKQTAAQAMPDLGRRFGEHDDPSYDSVQLVKEFRP